MVEALFLPHNVLVYKTDKLETFPGLCSISAPVTSMAPAFIFRAFRKLEDIKQKHDTFGLSDLFWSIQTCNSQLEAPYQNPLPQTGGVTIYSHSPGG